MTINVTDKMVLEIEEHNGGYSILQGYINRDGVFQPEFCLKRNWKTGEFDNKKPLSVYCGKSRIHIKELADAIYEMLAESSSSFDEPPF
jgi:hypothetical protein